MFVEAWTVSSPSICCSFSVFSFFNVWKYITKYYNSVVNYRVLGIDKSVVQSENIIRNKQKAIFYCNMVNGGIARLS